MEHPPVTPVFLGPHAVHVHNSSSGPQELCVCARAHARTHACARGGWISRQEVVGTLCFLWWEVGSCLSTRFSPCMGFPNRKHVWIYSQTRTTSTSDADPPVHPRQGLPQSSRKVFSDSHSWEVNRAGIGISSSGSRFPRNSLMPTQGVSKGICPFTVHGREASQRPAGSEKTFWLLSLSFSF